MPCVPMSTSHLYPLVHKLDIVIKQRSQKVSIHESTAKVISPTIEAYVSGSVIYPSYCTRLTVADAVAKVCYREEQVFKVPHDHIHSRDPYPSHATDSFEELGCISVT